MIWIIHKKVHCPVYTSIYKTKLMTWIIDELKSDNLQVYTNKDKPVIVRKNLQNFYNIWY